MPAAQLDLFSTTDSTAPVVKGSQPYDAPEQDLTPLPAAPMSPAAKMLGHVRFLINTPVVTLAIAELCEWLLGGLLGGVFIGLPRLGKTRGARFCLKALPHMLGFAIPFVEIPLRKIEEKEIRTDSDFFSYLLKRISHVAKRGSTSDKRDRFIEYCVGQAKRSGANTFIIYIDEAQKISPQHLTWLLECCNEIEEQECRLFILMTAQPQFSDVRDELVKGGDEQFVARFMLGTFDFRGLQAKAEVKLCLENYSSAEYPAGSGRSFASNYLVTAPDPELDLSKLDELFWREFLLIWLAKITDQPLDIPMHYFTASVIRFLLFRGDPKNHAKTNPELVRQAVQRCRFDMAVEVRAAAKIRGAVEEKGS